MKTNLRAVVSAGLIFLSASFFDVYAMQDKGKDLTVQVQLQKDLAPLEILNYPEFRQYPFYKVKLLTYVKARLLNETSNPIEICSMSCSYDEEWTTDNPQVEVQLGRACDRNGGSRKILTPGESWGDYYLLLIVPMSYKDNVATFRLGFKGIDRPNDSKQSLCGENVTKETFWSDVITVPLKKP